VWRIARTTHFTTIKSTGEYCSLKSPAWIIASGLYSLAKPSSSVQERSQLSKLFPAAWVSLVHNKRMRDHSLYRANIAVSWYNSADNEADITKSPAFSTEHNLEMAFDTAELRSHRVGCSTKTVRR
jgi:hypothetical protein